MFIYLIIKKMEINLLLFFFIIKLISADDYNIITDFNQLIQSINNNYINFNDSKIIIDSVKTIMNEYPFINILKDPPKIDGKEYFKKVDIIKELDDFQSNIEKNSINFYEYYQRYLKIICDANDLHIGFTYSGKIDYLKYIIILSPFEMIIDKDKKLFLSPNSLFKFLGIEDIIPGYKTIIDKANVQIKTINDIDPFEFIRNFCKDYFNIKKYKC